jgi:hypothetical protein
LLLVVAVVEVLVVVVVVEAGGIGIPTIAKRQAVAVHLKLL